MPASMSLSKFGNFSHRRRSASFPSFYHIFLLVTILKIVSSDKNSLTSPNNIPDQIAMAAEQRIGHSPIPYGPPAGFGGPPPPGFGPSAGQSEDAWPAASSTVDMPQIKVLQVQCEKSHMRVNIEFDRPFYGMIFSKGHYSDPSCVHLAPGSGHLSATFDIYLNACGMTSSANNNGVYGPAPSGTFVENTIIIQYDALVQEVWDQARKLRCTWYDFYEKSVTFRPFQVDMLHAVTANFLGDNLQCWMQIQVGKGPWASEVSGIVKIGQTMTMVLAIKDDENKFDMLVRNCVAHDGKRAPIQLVDQYGCVTRPKIMSRFHKIKNFGASASVVSYAYFQAFKFPDSMNVHFQCVIQVCRFQCPEPKCNGEEPYGPPGLLPQGSHPVPDPRIPQGAYSENKETIASPPSRASSGEKDRVPPPGKPMEVKGHNGYNKPQLIPVPISHPSQPSHIMLPPLPPLPPQMAQSGYSSVKREGLLHEDDDEEEEEQESLFTALGGRPRSVDFDKNEGPAEKREKRATKDIFLHVSHVYKREAQEMTDVETTRVIQVVAPGDVAFSLGGNSNSSDSVVIESSNRSELDGVCMSVASFVWGLVTLLLLLVIATLVAAFLFVRVRSIHIKSSVFASGFENPEYIKNSST